MPIPIPLVTAGLGALVSLFGGGAQRKRDAQAAGDERYARLLQLFQQDKQFAARQGLDTAQANVGAQGQLLAGRSRLDDRALADRNSNALLPIRRQLANQVAARFGATPIDFSKFAPVKRTANIDGLAGAVGSVGSQPGYTPMAAPLDPNAQKKKSSGLFGKIVGLLGGVTAGAGLANAAGLFGRRAGDTATTTKPPTYGAGGIGGGFRGYGRL